MENDFQRSTSKLDFLFPSENIKDDYIVECQEQIEEKIHKLGYKVDGKVLYRNPERPTNEQFFTSKENRDRFEKIILKKSIEIYNRSEKLLSEPRPKPLGYGLYTDISLGFGALIFTWRNVPFNVPLVFWYSGHGWLPLFERKFVTYGDPGIQPQVARTEDDGYGEDDDYGLT